MNGKEVKHCSLCFHNGEPEEFYSSHNLKTRDGRVVTCPVLRKFVCNICGATADRAHTLRYCPLNKDGAFSNGASLPQLKTRRNAAGNFSSRRMLCHPLPSSCRARDDVRAEVLKLESEAAKLRETYLAPRPPVAVRTFGGKSVQPALINSGGSGSLSAAPGYHNPGRQFHNNPWPFMPQEGSVYLGTHMKDVGLGMLSKEHGFFAKQSAYQNMYPLSRLVYGRNEPVGYGAANINERLEEDVGRLLAELRLGTTAVEMK